MDKRTLQMIQRGLIAAVSLVLALIVVIAFTDLLRPADATSTPRTTTTTEPTEVTAGEDEPTSTQVEQTTTTAAGAVAPAICIENEPPDDGSTILRVFYPCGQTDLATAFVYREVAPTDLVLTATFGQLTRGLEDEETDLGFRTPLPEGAANSFSGVTISEGTAYVEFRNTDVFPPGVNTVEGAQVFLSTLNANVFQFSTIDAVAYRVAGSRAAFWAKPGEEKCVEITRADWQTQQASP